MDLNRVTRIEQSVHKLLADPEANHLTKPQQKEWKAIDVALQHLMQKMKSEEHGGQKRPAPPQSSFSASQQPPSSTGQTSAPPQSTTPAPAPGGVPPPDWAEPQAGSTGAAGGGQSIENQVMSGSDGSLDSMLYELEMALKAAQEERQAARQGNHGKHGDHGHKGHGGHGHATSATSASGGAGSKSVAGVGAANGASGAHKSAHKSSGKSDPDGIMNIGKPGAYHTSSYGKELGDNKKTIIKALDDAGATPKEKALVMAMFMQETNHMNVSEGDRSKDGDTGGSKNFSALNMNEAMLRGNGTPGAPGLSTFDPSVDLNDQANVGKAAVLCLDGIRERGPEAWIAGQRGGAPAAERQDKNGTAITGAGDQEYFSKFYDSIATDYAAIMKDPSLLTNDLRVENDSSPAYG